jgi:signal transduction histidine kinase
MKTRSFQLRVFVLLLLVAFTVIFSNRLIAQFFLTQQLRDQIHVDMGRVLIACSSSMQDKPEFLSCFHAVDEGSLVGSASDFYVLCPKVGHAAEAIQKEVCAMPFTQEPERQKLDDMPAEVELLRGLRQAEMWYQARSTGMADGPVLWLKQSDADVLVDRLWKLRDRNLFRVAPIIFTLLAILSWLCVQMLLRPMRLMEQTISSLNDANLGQASDLQAPYREFESFVNVYDSLRTRLFDSFSKARRFASDVSHELRTPLTILRGSTEQLIRDLPTGSDLQVRVRNMGDEVERLIDITEKLLLLSRADANSLGRTFSVENLSDMAVQLIAQDQDHEQDPMPLPFAITSAIEPQVLWNCDQTLAKLLLQNLFENAQKYNFNQGWIHVSLKREGTQFRFSIENSSLNIAADLEARAFDRFYRGDASHTRQVDGLGLGLSICSEIAKVHQAHLSLRVTEKKSVLITLIGPLSLVHARVLNDI